MNLNKYDSQGWPYTAEEAAERAYATFNVRMFYPGYHRNSAVNPDGTPHVFEAVIKPYNVGRNRAKRLAKERTAYFRSLTR
jgi:hypothetical protein